MGYNPNDCPEVRWGAPAGSAERVIDELAASRANERLRERLQAAVRERGDSRLLRHFETRFPPADRNS
jgi:hypothetical protein